MFNEARPELNLNPAVSRDALKDHTADRDREPSLTLQAMALALVARLSLAKDRTPQAPEEQFLFDYYAQLQSGDASWLQLLQRTFAEPAPRDKELILLADVLKLSTVEVLSAALALAVEEDPLIGRCLSHVQAPMGNSRPTLGLLGAAFAPLSGSLTTGHRKEGHSNWTAGDIATGMAVRTGLLNLLNETAPLPEQIIQMPGALAMALRDQPFALPGTRIGLPHSNVTLPQSILQIAQKHATSIAKTGDRALVIRSSSIQERRAVAAAIAGFLQMKPIFMDLTEMHPRGLGPLCLMKKLLPVFSLELAPGEHRMVSMIPGYHGAILMLTGLDGSLEYERGSTLSWSVPIPRKEERFELWQSYLDDRELSIKLAADHLHGAGRIAELSDLSKREAELAERSQPTRGDIRRAAWLSEGGGLGSLAQAISTDVPDKALVLRPQTRQELLLLIQRCRGRETLGDSLGITVKTSYQAGVRALFIGPSGTGKTIASGWLATHLSLPLYRVDLAAVTSKYIGETEKNLSKLLAKAEQDEVVLLFDEADALFGKRTEVKDANDRFANAQTNYLLQRIESYKGIVILTSNSRARFDPAFTRRLDMIIDFPAPGPEERRELWQTHLGPLHHLNTKQLNQLSASCDLCGGHIRNAVLTAAVMAQAQNRPIDLIDIIHGLMGEYKKLGRQLPIELKSAVNAGSNRLITPP